MKREARQSNETSEGSRIEHVRRSPFLLVDSGKGVKAITTLSTRPPQNTISGQQDSGETMLLLGDRILRRTTRYARYDGPETKCLIKITKRKESLSCLHVQSDGGRMVREVQGFT